MSGIESAVGADPLALQIETFVFFLITLQMLAFAWTGLPLLSARTVIFRPWAWLAAVLVLFASLTTLFTSSFGLSEMLLAVEFSLCLVLSLAHPALALGFFLAQLFLRPWEVTTDPAPLLLVIPRLTGILALASWALHSLKDMKFEVHWDRSTTLLFAFAGWVFLSTFRCPSPADAQRMWFDSFFRTLILFFLCSNVLRTPRELRFMMAIVVISVSGVTLMSLHQYTLMTPEQIAQGERLQTIGSLANSNDVAGLAVLALPIALGFLLRRTSSVFMRLGTVFFTALMCAGLVLAQSRGAYLGICGAGACYVFSRIKRKGYAVAAAVLLLAVAFPLMSSVHRSSADTEGSTESRMNYWRTAIKMAVRNPLIGVGFNQYPEQFESYTELFTWEWGKRTVHSTWLLALAETGFPGLFLLLAFFFVVVGKAWRAMPFEPPLTLALAGYAVVITFLSHTYTMYPYILFGLCVAAERIYVPTPERIRRERLPLAPGELIS